MRQSLLGNVCEFSNTLLLPLSLFLWNFVCQSLIEFFHISIENFTVFSLFLLIIFLKSSALSTLGLSFMVPLKMFRFSLTMSLSDFLSASDLAGHSWGVF